MEGGYRYRRQYQRRNGRYEASCSNCLVLLAIAIVIGVLDRPERNACRSRLALCPLAATCLCQTSIYLESPQTESYFFRINLLLIGRTTRRAKLIVKIIKRDH